MFILTAPIEHAICIDIWSDVVQLWTDRLELGTRWFAATHLEQWLRANCEGVVS